MGVAERRDGRQVGGTAAGGGRHLGLHQRIEVAELGVEHRVLHGRHPDPQYVGTGGIRFGDEGGHPGGVGLVPSGLPVLEAPGRRHQTLGVVRADHHHHQVGLLVGEVDLQLGRPVEIVGSGQPGVDASVEVGGDIAVTGERVDQGLPEVEADRVTDDQDLQRRRRGGVVVEGRQRRRRRGAVHRGGQGFGRRAAGRDGQRGSAARGPPERPVGAADHRGEAHRAAEGGDGSDDVERDGPPGPERRLLGRALQAGGVEEEPEAEAHQADEEGTGPGDAAEGEALPERMVAEAVVATRGLSGSGAVTGPYRVLVDGRGWRRRRVRPVVGDGPVAGGGGRGRRVGGRHGRDRFQNR